MHNEKLHNLYPPPNITVNKNDMRRACSMHGSVKRNAYRVLVGKPEGQTTRKEDTDADGRIILN
jgi:hypothetical protein